MISLILSLCDLSPKQLEKQSLKVKAGAKYVVDIILWTWPKFLYPHSTIFRFKKSGLDKAFRRPRRVPEVEEDILPAGLLARYKKK